MYFGCISASHCRSVATGDCRSLCAFSSQNMWFSCSYLGDMLNVAVSSREGSNHSQEFLWPTLSPTGSKWLNQIGEAQSNTPKNVSSTCRKYSFFQFSGKLNKHFGENSRELACQTERAVKSLEWIQRTKGTSIKSSSSETASTAKFAPNPQATLPKSTRK